MGGARIAAYAVAVVFLFTATAVTAQPTDQPTDPPPAPPNAPTKSKPAPKPEPKQPPTRADDPGDTSGTSAASAKPADAPGDAHNADKDHKGHKDHKDHKSGATKKSDNKVRHSTHSRPGGRPHFLKGELSRLTAARPNIPDRFVGLSTGISALPKDIDGALNTLYMSIEPQIDIKLPKLPNLKMSFGLPLRFQLAEFRGSFNRCLDVGLNARAMGATQADIATATATCISDEHDLVSRAEAFAFGGLRKLDWDEFSEFAKVIRYVRYGGDERKINLDVGPAKSQSLGHGTVIRRYNPNLDFNTTRVGVTFDAYHSYAGFESVVNDVLNPDVAGFLGFIRPLEPHAPNNVFLSRLSFGGSAVVGRNVPGRIRYQRGLFAPSEGLAVPTLDSDQDIVTMDNDHLIILGVDIETKLIRLEHADLKVYIDLQKILGKGKGYTVGGLARLSLGHPPDKALRIRGELHYFEPNYMPSFFDSFFDVHKYQYLQAGYRSSDGLAYFPTKLEYLDANARGKDRVGAYLSAALSVLGKFTVGLTVRGSFAVGKARDPGFAGPQFEDYSRCSFAADESLDCSGVAKITVDNAGYASLRIHGEMPFNKYVQGFVIYEVSSNSLDREGLDLLNFDADNELFLSGFRLKPFSWMWLQGEVHRHFFVPRVSNVDTGADTLQQDQNYRSAWTFAASLYVGRTY